MNITVQVGNNLIPLVEGQPLPVQAGETLRVSYSFKYRLPVQATVPLWASLYQTTRVEAAQTKTTIILERATDWQDYQGQVDIDIGSSVPTGTYGLIVELPGYKDAEVQVDDCLAVAGSPGLMTGLTEWLGPLMMMAMMGMMMQMMPTDFE